MQNNLCLLILALYFFLGIIVFNARRRKLPSSRQRLDELKTLGLTIEYRAIVTSNFGKVIEAEVGFGREFWLLPKNVERPNLENRLRIINNGLLILEDGKRTVSKKKNKSSKSTYGCFHSKISEI